jgi:hypothetical protein
LTDNVDNAEKWLVEELTSIISFNNDAGDNNINNISETPASSTSTEFSYSLFDHFDQKVTEVRSIICPNVSATLMMRQYLKLPHLHRGKNSLDFWKQHKMTLPELYKLQLKYLCKSATSVPSERILSKAGLLTNNRRNRLSPKI